MKGTLSLRGFRKLRTGAIVATGVFLIGLASIQTTVQASEENGVWVARTVEQVKADIQKEDNFFKYEIKWGDTLSVISEATNIPVEVLKEMNRVSDRNLFLPHNELLYTEGESVTDSKTKHKIVIKETYGKKEVRTYEVILQNNHETAEVSFELKETTEEVQKSNRSVVSYGEVYNLVSEVAPAQPVEDQPAASGTTETTTPAPGGIETPASAQPTEDQPVVPGTTEKLIPAQPTEETPVAPGGTETPAPAQPAEEHPAAPGITEKPAPAQPTEEQPAAPGATETPAPTKPVEDQPTAPGATEKPTPAQPTEETPVAPGATETPAPAQPMEDQPTVAGTTETPAPAQPAEEHPAAPGATETPTQPEGENSVDKEDSVKKAKDDSIKENIMTVYNRKLEIINKLSDENEKNKLKMGLEALKNEAVAAITEANDENKVISVTEHYQTAIDGFEVPGEEFNGPDFSKEGLSNGRNDGTIIDENSSGNIGHASSSPTSNTSNEASNNRENTGFRNAPVYQPRVTRRARSVDEPMDKVAIYYNYTEMKDIAGFLGDPGETVVTVPKGATHEQVQAIVKSKIDEKKAELAKKGYTFLEDYFVDKPQEDTIRYDYIVNFTKPSSLRMAPMIQPRASRTRRSVEEPKVKTRTITLYYQLAELEIAGSLGNPGQNYVITVPETATAEEIQQAIDQQTSREKASLSRYFQYVGETNLKNDILDRGFGNFDYVITFARRK